ncbi:PPPDE peptidase [Gracilaria domingensis]|nr:PPPDE peptidase [Gracilaria domingensis]
MSTVTLHVYDLSQGMARQLSPMLIGKQIDGIWHTGVEVYNREYYFGGGICSDPPNQTPYGTPHSVETLGTTTKSKEDFLAFLRSVSHRFAFDNYHLLENNCNNFSDACTMFLLDKHVPQYILDLPAEAMNSPLGPTIRPIIDQMQASIRNQSMGHEEILSVPRNEPSQAPSYEVRSDPVHGPALDSSSSAFPVQLAKTSRTPEYWKYPITLANAERTKVREKLHKFDSSFSPDENPHFDKILSSSRTCPLEKAFPVLDFLRLYILESDAYAIAAAHEIGFLCDRYITASDSPDSARIMALRAAINLFAHEASTLHVCREDTMKTVIDAFCHGLESPNLKVRMPAAILGLNIAGASRRHKDAPQLAEDDMVRLLYAGVARLNSDPLADPKESTPLMQMLVIIADSNEESRAYIAAFDLNVDVYREVDSCPDDDTRTAARHLSRMLAA